jgi:hypothetical protein
LTDSERARTNDARERCMIMLARRVTAVLLAAGFAVTACSKDETASPAVDSSAGPPGMCDLPPSCKQITQACMPKDDGTPGPVHNCHVTGMEKGIETGCDKDLASCLSTCGAAPGFSDAAPDDIFALCKDGGTKPDASNAPVTFPVSPLSTFASDGKDLTIELRTAPEQPIHVGPDGEGQLRITDTSTGAIVDGLTIAVTTWMPVMGHECSPVPVRVEPKGQGIYLLTPLLASMKGACEIKLAFSGTKTEHAVSPTFDVTQ